jgi:hypothetical protein
VLAWHAGERNLRGGERYLVRIFKEINGVHSRVKLRCHAVEMVGSQGLPMRALWMASMARTSWPRELTR